MNNECWLKFPRPMYKRGEVLKGILECKSLPLGKKIGGRCARGKLIKYSRNVKELRKNRGEKRLKGKK